MKIILAKSAGFCFGVRRAVELTEQTAAKVAESGGAAKVFTFGELIHNRDVVNRLREAGIAPNCRNARLYVWFPDVPDCLQ